MSKSSCFVKSPNSNYKVTPKQLYELQELINNIREEGSPTRSSEDSQIVEKSLINTKNRATPVRPKLPTPHVKIEDTHPSSPSVKTFQIRRTNIFIEGDKTPRSKKLNFEQNITHKTNQDASVIIHEDAEDSEFKGIATPSPFRLKKIVIPVRNPEKSPDRSTEIQSSRGNIASRIGERIVDKEGDNTSLQLKISPRYKNNFVYDPEKSDRVLIVDYGQSPHQKVIKLENKPVRPSNMKPEVSPREKRAIQTDKFVTCL